MTVPEPDSRITRLLASAEELARLGSWEYDLGSGGALWSNGMYRILGLPPQTTRVRAPEILEHVHPDDRERMERLLTDLGQQSANSADERREWDVRIIRADGAIRELRVAGRIEHDKAGTSWWIGTAQDVTEQRLSERELRAHYTVSQALREWASFETGAIDLLRRIATALEYPLASLWLWEASTKALVCRAFWRAPHVAAGDFEIATRALTFRAGEGTPGRAWLTCEPVVTPTVATDPVFRPRDAAVARGVTSAVAFPAVGPAGPVAVLSFYSFEPRVPSAELVRTLTAIGSELGRFLSLRRAELGPRPVSRREIEVLRHAAEGRSGPEIAERLMLSPATVKTHFQHIYEKLGVGDRAAAVAHALRTGLIS